MIIDFDKPGSPLSQSDTRCDFLFVAEGGDDESVWVAPLELKGRLNVSRAVQQLQAGASAAEALIPEDAKVNLRPVVAYKGIPKAERTALKNKVRFRTQTEVLRLIKCGSPILQALR